MNLSQRLLSMQDVVDTLRRPVCELLGSRLALVAAGMGGVARWELVAAVTQAGGFGFLGMVRESPELIREEIDRLRAANVTRFGVNLIPSATDPALLEAEIEACLERRVPVIGLFWDIHPAVIRRFKDAGALVVHQIGSVDDARRAQDAGADVLIAQGVEAGGHVRGECPLTQLLPDVLAATSIPVLAAGGVSSGDDVATLLSLGAQGVVLGTALIATHESFAHDYHKRRIVDAPEGQTLLTEAFHVNWPRGAKVRVLPNSVTRGERGDPFAARPSAVIGQDDGRPIHLFSTDSPLRTTEGELEAMALYAGQGAGRIDMISGAADRLVQIARDAARGLRSKAAQSPPPVELSSPVCYLREFEAAHRDDADGLEREALLASLNEMLEAERAGARLTLRAATEFGPAGLSDVATAIHRDEVKWCGVLIAAIQSLGATPSSRTGAFYDKAMAIGDPRERMAFLNRGQGWVVKRLRALLPRIDDERIADELAEMLLSHQQNIGRVEQKLTHPEKLTHPTDKG